MFSRILYSTKSKRKIHYYLYNNKKEQAESRNSNSIELKAYFCFRKSACLRFRVRDEVNKVAAYTQITMSSRKIGFPDTLQNLKSLVVSLQRLHNGTSRSSHNVISNIEGKCWRF